ncbi:flagellar assembly peptidoglycan hydrolase FlgJ [Marinobacter goseongensis]|uniref:flagellar assembly peptidoglycan hydrolase FlgJ n=1 Tax=Marinobacter goseongensis TaxID=453838 RepID=UPI0020052945|nr:flagellar assembly peptidoglycan hydrolase FlgJ [Marinobacter goseongensis]MCK7551843.1 flagellar assembly peptidoglycan hydrolase FlgJ [Marinobacter goseongensis]
MQDSSVQQARIYTDFSGLNELKNQARTDKKAALQEVARQFESLFLGEMLKSMRKAGDVFAEGNYLNSNESEHYRDMFDNQLSLSLSQKQGTGLAEALVRQLSRQIPGMNEEGDKLSGHKATLADYDRAVPVLSERLPERVQEVNRVAPPGKAADVAEAIPVADSAAPPPKRFSSPEEFVQTLLPMAQRVARDSGISPRLMVAQAALETGWGKHMIEGGSGEPSHNLFGIKADHRWQGEAVDITTTEFREGVPMSERAAFRAYPDYESSFRDYVAFLESNPRYRDVLASADRPELFAQKLQDAGYATDPEYGAKIRRIMNGDSLMTLSLGESEAEE